MGIRWTATSVIYEIINEDQVSNCNITGADAIRAVEIYGKEELFFKSLMKRVKLNRHLKAHKVPLPTKLFENHGDIVLYIDIFL